MLNVSSVAGYGGGSALGAAWLRSVITNPLASAVAAAMSASGVPTEAANVTVSQVADVTLPFVHAVLYQAVDVSPSPALARRRLGGASAAGAASAQPSLYVRVFVTLSNPVASQSALLTAADLPGELLRALRALGVPGRAAGDPLAPAQFASAWVELGEVSVPPVIPWPSTPARPPPAAQNALDPLLGLSVGQWVGVAFGIAVGVVVGSAFGYSFGRRSVPPRPPSKTRRGHLRRRGRQAGPQTQGTPGAFVVSGAVARDEEEEEYDDEEEDDEEDEEDDGSGEAVAVGASRGIFGNKPPPRREAGGGKPPPRREGSAGAAAEDGSVGETVNPMLRLKLKGKPRRKAGAFAVTADDAAPRVVAVMDAPRPIERVVFDFTVTALTNPYHLLFLGEPTFVAMIDKEVERATSLARVCRAAVERLDEDMLRRRAALAKGGVSETTKSSRLLDVVSELAIEAQRAGHAASAEDVAARAAELTAYTVAKADKALAELRRSKYDELALDLLRLKNVLVRGDETRMRVRSVALPKAITSFEPTSRLTGNERARAIDRLQRAFSVRLPAPGESPAPAQLEAPAPRESSPAQLEAPAPSEAPAPRESPAPREPSLRALREAPREEEEEGW